MFHRLILVLTAMLALLALPAQASDLNALTETERAALRDEIRNYLLDEPQLLLEIIAELERLEAEQQAAGDLELVSANADELFNDGYSHVSGNPEGDVTIVEFVDYRCGYCRRAFPEVAELVNTDGNIRLVLKEYPILGEESVLSARFAISSQLLFGEEAYEKLHDALMTLRGNATEESLVAVADELGLDGQAILDGLSDPRVDQIIGNNHLLAQRMQITGTPTFVVETEMLRGYLPAEGMQAVVERVRTAKEVQGGN